MDAKDKQELTAWARMCMEMALQSNPELTEEEFLRTLNRICDADLLPRMDYFIDKELKRRHIQPHGKH